MTIHVDALLPCISNRKWPWTRSGHLYTDPGNEEELHRFAASLGFRGSWFQDKKDLPHYDLTPGKWDHAVREGAIKHTRRQCCDVMQAYRALNAPSKPPNQSENSVFSDNTEEA